MNLKTQKITQILFFGSIWGIIEATLGYILHFLPTLIAGTILFPIVTLLLIKAYALTKSKSSLFFMGVVASLIKSVNFFLPQISIWKTINPMISILLEALMVIAFISLLNPQKTIHFAVIMIGASIAWRVLFLFNLQVQFLFTGFQANQIASFSNMISFAIGSGIISSLFGFLFYALLKPVIIEKTTSWKLNFLSTLPVFVIAILFTLFL